MITERLKLKNMRSLILAQSAQSAQFYFLIADLDKKSKSVKMCKKFFTHFYTFKNLNFNSLVKKLAKYCYFDKNVKFFCNFLRKTNSFRNLRKYYFEFLNFKLKNELKFKIK